VKITILMEGQTESVFLAPLREFLRPRLSRMPKLDPFPCRQLLPIESELKKTVELLLSDRKDPSDAVIALTDVYTGTNPPRFNTAKDAKEKMRSWVGDNDRFHPHAAQYEFEAWLLPYWDQIQKLARHNMASPRANPELVNHGKPPSHHLKAIYRAGNRRDEYSKTRDALRILRNQDLTVAADQCPELKAFLNTILQLCGGTQLP
jgi:hypothetical protein